MQKARFKIVPTSHLILIDKSRILLLRRFNTGYEDGKYSVIAGHLDGSETFTHAMIREAKEEANIDVKHEDIEVVHVMHRKLPDHERVNFFIQAKKWSGQPKIMEPDKCDDLSWFELDKLPNNIVPYVRQALECIRNKVFYSEHGW